MSPTEYNPMSGRVLDERLARLEEQVERLAEELRRLGVMLSGEDFGP